MFVLAMKVNQRCAYSADHTCSGGGSADPSPVPAFRRDLTAENEEAILEPKTMLIHESLYCG